MRKSKGQIDEVNRLNRTWQYNEGRTQIEHGGCGGWPNRVHMGAKIENLMKIHGKSGSKMPEVGWIRGGTKANEWIVGDASPGWLKTCAILLNSPIRMRDARKVQHVLCSGKVGSRT